VGSAGRAVFHRADCQWARKIKPENRIEYATREDAIADGLRPCGVCRP
jgi:micrococcal nuclease